jgi:hypothetical protein
VTARGERYRVWQDNAELPYVLEVDAPEPPHALLSGRLHLSEGAALTVALEAASDAIVNAQGGVEYAEGQLRDAQQALSRAFERQGELTERLDEIARGA